MEKNTYGTYEYLSTDNVNEESNQFFVVHEDGTYLLNRPIQYITEVADGKEMLDNVETPIVYDVTPQQFYVNVENVSSELISVSDQFAIPQRTNNLYANSYLLPGSSIDTTNQEIDQDITNEEFKPNDTQMDVDIDTNINKNTNNYTEITLHDEQYSQLEDKGWIMLEINEKVFILDTLGGLRDITTDEKLIEKLKAVNQNDNIRNKSGSMSVNNTSRYDNTAHTSTQQEFVIKSDDNVQIDDNVQNLSFVITDREECTTSEQIPNEHQTVPKTSDLITLENKETRDVENNEEDTVDVKIFVIDNETSDSRKQDSNVLRIKTKLTFKDFPDKIVLGKTINGKKLVAKVKKKETCSNDLNNHNGNHIEVLPNHSKDTSNVVSKHTDTIGLDISEFTEILEESLQGSNGRKISAKDFEATEILIMQLIKIPSFKTSILCYNLCITKEKRTEDVHGNVISRSKPTLVTGQVRLINNQWRFIHIPDMVLKLTHGGEYGFVSRETGNAIGSHSVLHIHVLETEQKHGESNVVKTAVSVIKRNLPYLNEKNYKTKKVYACAACAALYNTEEELMDHQKIHCTNVGVEPDSKKPGNTKSNEAYYIENGKEKIYCCMQCNARFKRLSFCKNHIKAHPKNPMQSESNEENQTKNGIYKCNMCPCTYFHSSTLSKHIVTRHIQVI